MRKLTFVVLFALTACGGTDPGPPDDDDDGNGGGNPIPPSLDLVRPKNDGSGQEGTVDRFMPQPFVIRVMHNGSPMPGIFVDWEAITPGASMNPATSQTDAYGYASSSFRANQTVGTQYGKVILGEKEELFWVMVGPGAANGMIAVPSTDSVPVDGFLSKQIRVVDVFGNGVPDIPTEWTWTATGGPFELFDGDTATSTGGGSRFAIWFGASPATAELTVSLPTYLLIPSLTFSVESF